MAKKYFDNHKLQIAYDYYFSNIKCNTWENIHSVLDITSGDNLPKRKMIEGKYQVYGGGGITNNSHNAFNIDYETIGIGRVGARCGCVFNIEKNSWVTDNALLVQSFDERLSLNFLKHYLNYQNLGQFANNAMQPVISKTRISIIKLPIIDLVEQNKIANNLDILENNTEDYKDLDNDLLSKISVVDKWKELNIEVQTQKQLLDDLKQSILQEAIQAKLTQEWRALRQAQDDHLETASELVKRIKAEKKKLIRDKKVRKGKKQKSIDLGNIKPAIPETWVYADLDDICQFVTDGTHQTPRYTTKGRMFLSAQNVKPFKFMPKVHKYVSEKTFTEISKGKKTEKGDLLIGRVGSKGETAVIDRDLDFAFYVSLGFVKTFKNYTSPEYLAIVLNSPYGNIYAKGNMSSIGASAGNFNLGRIRSFPIPFPPYHEQKTIVEKVKALMQKCNALEQEITQSEKHANMLMQAVLKEAFEGKNEVI